MLRLALFEPDIPQNAGTLMRLCACLGVAMDIIEPCGFLLTDKNLKRAGMDYLERLDLARHTDWTSFQAAAAKRRLVLLTTKARHDYTGFRFEPNDTLIVGRESSGVPDAVHDIVSHKIVVPMVEGVRSLNVAVSAAMVLGEALRQTASFPAS